MLKHILSSTLFVGLLLMFVSCASGQQQSGSAFENLKIYPRVVCSADTTLCYALQLPEKYEKDKPCPLLILFDPHGDGLLPVYLFSAAAATNNFIIAGSLNSKNGLPYDKTSDIYRKMISDITSRFNIENKAVYLCGFSGGSRVSGAVALTIPGIAGVVGCGAGMPNLNSKPVNAFSYLAIAGNRDFNLAEMKYLDESLEHAGYQHHLIVFNGSHQWPPKEVVSEIFTWLHFDAMRRNVLPVDQNELNAFIVKNDSISNEFENKHDLPHQNEVYLKMKHFLQGLIDTKPIEAEIARLAVEKEVVKYLAQQNKLNALETELQQKYSPALELKNLEWWEMESAQLKNQSGKTEKTELNLVYSRLLGYLSLNCYMLSTNAVKQKHLESAERYTAIYQMIDPENAEHRYLAAKIAALNHQDDAVFIALNQAIKLGFKDIERLKSDMDFIPYHTDERFKAILFNH